MAPREIGVVFQCQACGTFQVWSVDLVDQHLPKPEMSKLNPSNKQIKEFYEQVLIELQSRELARGEIRWLPCPTCTEFIHGALFDVWVREMGGLQLLPCIPVKYANGGVPLYRDDGVLGRSKWNLVEGVGPATLEVDKHCPFRLPAPQFKKLLPFATRNAIKPLRVNEEAAGQLEGWRKFLKLLSHARDLIAPEMIPELLSELTASAMSSISKSSMSSDRSEGNWVSAPWLAVDKKQLLEFEALIEGYIDNYKVVSPAASARHTPRKN